MGLGIQTTINFDTSGNFIHDAAKVEFVGGLARLIEFLNLDFDVLFGTAGTVDPPNNTVGDAEFSRGDGTVQAQAGSPVVVASALQLRGGVIEKRVEYDFTGVGTINALAGAVRIRVTPQYSGTPATTQTFWRESDGTIASQNENVVIEHLAGTGLLQAVVRRTNGTDIVVIQSAWAPVAGTTYEIELNFSTGPTVAASRLFLDGVQVGPTDNTVNVLRTGGTFAFTGSQIATDFPDFDVLDIQRFSAVQHTANYTPTGPTPLYSDTDPTVEVNSAPLADALKVLGPVVQDELGSGSSGAADEIRWLMKVDLQLMWWNGAAWANSDGTFAQSNTFADAAANITTLDLTGGKVFRPIPMLHANTGLFITTPSVTSVQYEYDFFVAVPALPTKVLVYGFARQTDGSIIAGATVEVEHSGFRHGSFQIDGDLQTALTDVDGRWELLVLETESVSLAPYEFRVAGQLFKGIQIPDAVSVDFGTLTPTG